MTHWSATEWTLAISAIGGTIVSIIYTIQKSRCTVINLPCGCHCVRELEEGRSGDNPTQSIPPISPLNPSEILGALSFSGETERDRDSLG